MWLYCLRIFGILFFLCLLYHSLSHRTSHPPTPLSQFVLKHKSLWGLREVGHCLGTLNPHREEGVRLVEEMLRQVVELHPGSTSLHIGADEVRPGILILLEFQKKVQTKGRR